MVGMKRYILLDIASPVVSVTGTWKHPNLRLTKVLPWRCSLPDIAGAFMTDNRLSIRIDLTNGDRIGPGKIALLEAIKSAGSISAAARQLGMSYRRAWLLVEEINQSLREPAVAAATGGKQGGGAALTPVGEEVITLYRAIERAAHSSTAKEFRAVDRLIRKGRAPRDESTKREIETPEERPMKLSARNMLKGTIVEVTKGQTTAHVRIDIGGSIVTSSITNEAVDELKLAKGQSAYAVVKASDVMIAID